MQLCTLNSYLKSIFVMSAKCIKYMIKDIIIIRHLLHTITENWNRHVYTENKSVCVTVFTWLKTLAWKKNNCHCLFAVLHTIVRSYNVSLVVKTKVLYLMCCYFKLNQKNNICISCFSNKKISKTFLRIKYVTTQWTNWNQLRNIYLH